MTWTRWPGLKPACSSQRPMRRILGLISPFQKSPSASICSVRTVGYGSVRVGDFRTPGIALCVIPLPAFQKPCKTALHRVY